MKWVNDVDFKAEFEELSNYDFKGHAGLSALYDGFGSTGEVKQFRVFTEIRKDRAFGMRDTDKIKEFSELLIEYGNLEYCRKLAKIGRNKAIKIIHILNDESLRRNKPLIYIFKGSYFSPISKLCANQVSIIKYLYHKGYSGDRLAAIYKVSQSTISVIVKGQTYKNIPSIISIKGERQKPKFANHKNIEYNITPEALSWLTDQEQSEKIFRYILWGDTPTCPFCGHNKHYKLNDNNLKCSNNKCYQKFTPVIATPFENTKIKPHQWLTAMSLYNDDRSISSHKLSTLLSTTQNTAWHVKKRIEKAYILPLWTRFYLIYNSIKKSA